MINWAINAIEKSFEISNIGIVQIQYMGNQKNQWPHHDEIIYQTCNYFDNLGYDVHVDWDTPYGDMLQIIVIKNDRSN